jgi:hypothetical protein
LGLGDPQGHQFAQLPEQLIAHRVGKPATHVGQNSQQRLPAADGVGKRQVLEQAEVDCDVHAHAFRDERVARLECRTRGGQLEDDIENSPIQAILKLAMDSAGVPDHAGRIVVSSRVDL